MVAALGSCLDVIGLVLRSENTFMYARLDDQCKGFET